MARGYCIGPTCCGCNEVDYQDCSEYKKMIAETERCVNELKTRPPFEPGKLQLPSVDDYSKWVLSKYNLSDNHLSARADLWDGYDQVLRLFYIEQEDDNTKRYPVRKGAQDRIYEIPLGFIDQDVREFFIEFLNRQS